MRHTRVVLHIEGTAGTKALCGMSSVSSRKMWLEGLWVGK